MDHHKPNRPTRLLYGSKFFISLGSGSQSKNLMGALGTSVVGLNLNRKPTDDHFYLLGSLRNN